MPLLLVVCQCMVAALTVPSKILLWCAAEMELQRTECRRLTADSCALQVLKLFEEFADLDYARAGSQATEDFDLAEGPLSGPTGPLPHTVEPTLRKYGLPTRLKKVWPPCCRLESLASNARHCHKVQHRWWNMVLAGAHAGKEPLRTGLKDWHFHMPLMHAHLPCLKFLPGVQGVVELVSDFVVCKEGDTLTSNQAALLRVFDVKMAAFKMYPVGCWLAKGVCKACNLYKIVARCPAGMSHM